MRFALILLSFYARKTTLIMNADDENISIILSDKYVRNVMPEQNYDQEMLNLLKFSKGAKHIKIRITYFRLYLSF